LIGSRRRGTRRSSYPPMAKGARSAHDDAYEISRLWIAPRILPSESRERMFLCRCGFYLLRSTPTNWSHFSGSYQI